MARIFLTVFALVLALAPVSAHAATLTNVSVTLSNPTAGQPTDLIITFTTPTTLDGSENPRPSLIGIDLGNGVNFLTQPTCSLVPVTATDDGVPISGIFSGCGTVGDQLEVRLAPGQVVQAGSVVQITLASSAATASATPGTYSPTLFRTIYSGGLGVDTPASMPMYTVVAPVAVPTLGEWALIAFGLFLACGTAVSLHRRRHWAH